MGAAVEVFPDSRLIEVGRDRFVPVKTTNDLLVLRSDVYDIGSDFVLDQVSVEVPFVDLDGKVYKVVAEFDKRFPEGTPSMRKATSLTVDGDFTFGAHVQVVGDVELTTDERRTHPRRHRPHGRLGVVTDPEPCSVEEHLERVLSGIRPLAPVDVPLLDALGLVCAEDVVATMSLPSFDNSAMDGYAVRQRRRGRRQRRATGAAAGRGRDRRRPGRAAHAGARHRRQDHDRRPGARRRRRDRPLRMDRPRHREGPHRRGARARPARPPGRRRRRGRRPAGEGQARRSTPGTSGCSRRWAGRRSLARPAAAGRRALDRHRAARARRGARRGLDLRRQLLHARRRGDPGRRRPAAGRHRPRRARRRSSRRCAARWPAPTSSSPPAVSPRATTTS